MKKLLKIYSSLLLFCMIIHPAVVLAVRPLQTVKKRIVKTYANLKNDRLTINNQYGDVVVKTWHQPKIMVVITLTAHAKTVTAASKILSRVNIAADRNENQISVVSLIKNPVKPLPAGVTLQKKPQAADSVANEKPLRKDGCNIHYAVFLPAGTALSVSNKFGNIIIGDYNGTVDLENKFGNIKGGSLTGASTLTVEQGDIEINHINNTNIRAKAFGSIEIGSLAGIVSGAFSSGNRLDIGLSNKADSVIIDADNIQKINITGTAATNAAYNVKAILSKLTNDSAMQLKELANNERKPQSKLGVDSLATLLKNSRQIGSEKDIELRKKKLQIILISQLKKLREYEGTSGGGKGKISLKVAFSSLSILN